MATVTVTATDREGHTAQAVVTYTPVTGGGFPDASTTGCKQSTTVTHATGFTYDSRTAIAGHATAGTGTASDPYVIERRLYGSDVRVRNCTGVWVKFRQCVFRGNPGNPTPSGSNYMWIEDTGAFVTLEDCTLTTVGGPSTNTTAGGVDHGFNSYVPFTLTRCDISMACIQVYCEIERSEGSSLIQDCYLHHTWSASGDHTDIVNGNFHASHVTVRHTTLDGVRTGGSVVTNGLGIYDDPSTSAGIITDWTIDRCLIKNCATGLLASTSKTRFLDPFVVTNNTWVGPFTVTRSSCRVPSTQSGNVDGSGQPVTI